MLDYWWKTDNKQNMWINYAVYLKGKEGKKAKENREYIFLKIPLSKQQ
jgi:hypothetical protein